jgi:hypothetical protein
MTVKLLQDSIPPDAPRKIVAAAQALRQRMRGRGWHIDIWENLGWHYAVRTGTLAVYPHSVPGDRAQLTYTCLMGDGSSGEAIWHGQNWHPSHADPNVLVQIQLQHAKECLAKYQTIIDESYQGLIDRTTETLPQADEPVPVTEQSPEDTGPITFFAVEAATETGYVVYVNRNQEEFQRHLANLRINRRTFDTYAIGTVGAANELQAMAKIRQGDWQYSQLT